MMKLYSVDLSGASFKVRLVAHELGAPVEVVTLNPRQGDTRTPEYMAKNPAGKVPTLEHDDFVLWESNAICCYLAALYPEAGLLPTDPRGRAEVDKWLFWQTAHLYPPLAEIAHYRGEPEPAWLEEQLGEFRRHAGVLERSLDGREHLTGRLSVADFAVAVALAVGDTARVDFSPYRNISAFRERMQSRPSWKATFPRIGFVL